MMTEEEEEEGGGEVRRVHERKGGEVRFLFFLSLSLSFIRESSHGRRSRERDGIDD